MRLRPSRPVVAALVALALAGLLAGPGEATIVVPVPEHELVLEADAIVVGRVQRIESEWDPAARQISTWITVAIDEVLKGDVATPEVSLKQAGGTVGGLRAWVHGSPEFRRRENVLVFLSESPDGSLRVTHLYQGKFSLSTDPVTGETLARRDRAPGVLVLPRKGGAPAVDSWTLPALKEVVKAWRSSRRSRGSLGQRRPAVAAATTQEAETFTFLNPPARWFEPDSGIPITVMTNRAGEPAAPGGGFEQVREALAAWTIGPESSLVLRDGGLTDAVGLRYDGVNSVSFRDPLNQIQPPSQCGGVLAIGGYYAVAQTTVVGGRTFYRIVDADMAIADGWEGCQFYDDRENLAEVLTHEIGHMVGFGHNTDPSATMYPYAHFDGRGATLTAADRAGLVFLYPGVSTVGPPPVRTLTVTRTGSGVIASTPAGISCGTDCAGGYDDGTAVQLVATPAAGWELAGWGGACGGAGACTVVMNGDRAVTATFRLAARPDLVVTAVNDPPATVGRGGRFPVRDTVANVGGAPSGAITRARYYLSATGTQAAGNVLLTGSRAVGALAPGAGSSGTLTVTVPLNAPPGTYRLLACADDTRLVAESDEANNCLASAGSVVVGLPDLVAAAVSPPPASLARGGRFQVTDTTRNQGDAPATSSVTRYYLSADGARDASDRLLTGYRMVPSLAPGAASTGTVTVVVPSTTVAGAYFVLACADDTARLVESGGANNCVASPTTVAVGP